MKLPHSYYLNDEVVKIAKDLIGKMLLTNIDGLVSGGVIIETEAYAGIRDKASHAHGGSRTARTEVLYQQGGIAYVYLCYGIHAMFNIVCGPTEVPDAVLIRGIKVCCGMEAIKNRLVRTKINNGIINGPGKVAKALGILTFHSGADLSGNTIWIEKSDLVIDQGNLITTPRIGIDYAEEDALLPYRFLINN